MATKVGQRGVRRQIVPATADRLRERIFAEEPGTQIGSLPELAQALGVGIVTVQQAARVLENEGLLEVRRGPGGGYYGRRPDAGVLERSLTAYMRTEPAAWADALDMTSLLFTELVAAAARCDDAQGREDLASLLERIHGLADDTGVFALEQEFQDILLRMVERPLFALLTRMTLRFSASRPRPLYRNAQDSAEWATGRRRIIAAILAGDAELGRFEADRHNRQVILTWLHSGAGEPV